MDKNAMSIGASAVQCELIENNRINSGVFILNFKWEGTSPKAGQFFMIKLLRSSVFLARPISIFEYNKEKNTIKFLIAIYGKGTHELSQMHCGEKAELIGPFGNAWEDFLIENGKIALVSGSAGVAPLAALVAEKPDYNFNFYAGFKTGFNNKNEENAILGAAVKAKKLIVAAEDGKNALNGSILDFFNPSDYDAVFSCGSTVMLKVVSNKCFNSGNIPCYLSMESRMACGTGACLGCTIKTVNGNRRCCTDGPIFPSQELCFYE